MSKLNPLYEQGDVKYFRKEHLRRMEQTNQPSVTYPVFYSRLKRGMRLRDAIYTPSNKNMVRYNMKHQTKTQKLKAKLTSIRIRFISFFKEGSPVNPVEKK